METNKERRTSTTITMPSWAVLLFVTMFLAAWSYIFLGMSSQVNNNTQSNIRQDSQIAVLQEQTSAMKGALAEINLKVDTLLRRSQP